MIYKLINNSISQQPCAVLRNNEDGTVSSFIFDPDNTDYQAYLKWVAEGGVPTPAENT